MTLRFIHQPFNAVTVTPDQARDHRLRDRYLDLGLGGPVVLVQSTIVPVSILSLVAFWSIVPFMPYVILVSIMPLLYALWSVKPLRPLRPLWSFRARRVSLILVKPIVTAGPAARTVLFTFAWRGTARGNWAMPTDRGWGVSILIQFLKY